MIYLEETFNLTPASPFTLDAFVKFSQEQLVPICQRLGSRLVAAWSSYVEWFNQVTQIMEFDNMEALKAFRIKTSQDVAWGNYLARLEEFSPERRSRLLEPLGTIPTEKLHKAIEDSQKTPLEVYGLAILEVAPGRMQVFKEGFEGGLAMFPIIASWRPIAGSPNEVIDLWGTQLLPSKFNPQGGQLLPSRFDPTNEFYKQFFGPLRVNAPRERLVTAFMLPYSPLR